MCSSIYIDLLGIETTKLAETFFTFVVSGKAQTL
jgi:hypothetical protein